MLNPEPSQEDLAKIPALQQKRTLAFVKHCVMTNLQCLNNFMEVCDEKLMLFERKLDRVDAAMVLLESKLLSIPEASVYEEVKEAPAVLEPIQDIPQDTETNTPAAQDTEVSPGTTTQDVTNDAKSRSQYDRFVKMVQVGVPLQAVKLKCALECLDPDVLDEILGK